MKIIILHIILIIVLSFQLNAQTNLVPNYSFELHDTCPYTHSGIDPFCQNWFTPWLYLDTTYNPSTPNTYGSSDYYNKCGTSNLSVPSNSVGYQISKTGDAYAGIGLLTINHPPNYPYHNVKEYIEVKLNSKLLKNRKYCVEFYYSATHLDITLYYPIAIEALITDTIVKRTPHPLFWFTDIHAQSQISQSLPIILDTVNWIKVSGSFIAKGGEQYLTIGNFQNTDAINHPHIYVYIDDVKLWYCDEDTTQEVDEMVIPNVFTPNDDGYNDKFTYKNQEQWKFETQIYSRWGNLVFENNNSKNWDGKIDGNLVTSGVYFYVIKAVGIRNGEIRIYRGKVTVMY